MSFTIEPGTTVALVGASGAGKSTLASLLLRFADPDRGSIRAGGVDIREIDPRAWRQGVAWVPQRPHLSRCSVAEAIAMSRPDATALEIERAAMAAEIHQRILGLPSGYDTIVGEGAIGLSGGEVQRIALARALLSEAPLLILDEPVARLDPELEARLVAANRRLIEGRTALVIAHRLTTVRQADRVVVIDSGRVVEQGSHEQLIASGRVDGRPGPYARLVACARGSATAGGSS